MKKILGYVLALTMILNISIVLNGCSFLSHDYATTWSFDTEYHWHKCLDSGCQSVSDKAEHSLGSNNICTVCGYSADWDNLGGGGQGVDITDADLSDATASDYIISNETNSSADEGVVVEDDYMINLSAINTESSYYEYADSVLTIKTAGTYELYGTLDGSIEVKKGIGEVTLILNGVTINSTTASAGILIGKDEGVTKTITVKGGTTNTINICDANSAIDEGDEEGAIQAKTCTLVINGGGTLNLVANTSGDMYSGIKAKYLIIDSTTININANKNGINSEFQIYIKNNANLNVTALGDGIKTDIEPADSTEASTYASSKEYGYIFIQNSNIVVVAGSASDYTSSNHGISANNCLYIDNSDSHTISVTTNGGAPSTVTETLSDTVAGKALRADGIELNDEGVSATYDENYAVVILGGNFEINSCSDAITSQGNLIISGGTFNIASGDDGIHAEYLTQINGGIINITKCYEGIEGASVEIYGGTLSIKSTDDGINAANADLSNYSYYILIAGGQITIDAEGDGIDSNGTTKITGGTIYVNGPTTNGNAALDAESGILTNGGDLIALGTKDMVESPASNSTQCYVNITCSSTISAGTTITVKNSSGSTIFTYTSLKSFQSVIISIDEFTLNETYTIEVGSTSYSATLSSIGTAVGKTSTNTPPSGR